MNPNTKIAAAVAAVLAAGASFAGQPTPASAASPNVALYIAGSSAAKSAVLGAIEGSAVCGGGASNYSVFSSTTDSNFYAVSCQPATATGLPSANGSNIFTIWYRDEGGSVTGALPLVSGSTINQLSLAGAAGSNGVYTVNVPGASTGNGVDDSFGSGVFKAPVQFGITDVEPGRLTGNNYPSAYSAAVYGKATATQLSNLTATTLFDQVFGVFVNTNSTAFTSAETKGQGSSTATLNLSQQTIANILNGGTTDWSDTLDTNGNIVATSGLAITIVNREQGSGSRTGTDLFFETDECNTVSQLPILETPGETDYFATGDVLTAANNTPGAITYATIDNAGSTSWPNLTLVAVNGVQPSQLNAAAGTYGDWFEATGVKGPNFSGLTADQQQLINALITAFQGGSTGPGGADILADPIYNSISLPVSAHPITAQGKTIYVNPFSRGTKTGNSCNVPVAQF
jgi:hypothetical protein